MKAKEIKSQYADKESLQDKTKLVADEENNVEDIK
jgi:hypothetical protein